MIQVVRTLVLLTGVLPLVALASQAEVFDTSGMPRRPTNFIEQQLLEMIGSHTAGDLTDAARIQRKLGRYYTDKGDESRATIAFQRAAKAEEAATEKTTPSAWTAAEVDMAPTPPPSLGPDSSAAQLSPGAITATRVARYTRGTSLGAARFCIRGSSREPAPVCGIPSGGDLS
jgi:hypothetical protein